MLHVWSVGVQARIEQPTRTGCSEHSKCAVGPGHIGNDVMATPDTAVGWVVGAGTIQLAISGCGVPKCPVRPADQLLQPVVSVHHHGNHFQPRGLTQQAAHCRLRPDLLRRGLECEECGQHCDWSACRHCVCKNQPRQLCGEASAACKNQCGKGVTARRAVTICLSKSKNLSVLTALAKQTRYVHLLL